MSSSGSVVHSGQQGPAATGPCCPLDWTRLGSDCYFFSQQHLNWNQSKSWCERKSAHLLILHSNQEWDFVTKKSVPDLYWVGLTDGRTGRWEWVNQTPYTIERRYVWTPGRLDTWTSSNEDCAHLHSNGRLNDIHCSTTMRFICQRPDRSS
uniref:C-type lectin domain family 10 member A-like n=1 Tax=Xiphophorus maculatus TaxID=8083 RepID=M3ZIB8_XIPMA